MNKTDERITAYLLSGEPVKVTGETTEEGLFLKYRVIFSDGSDGWLHPEYLFEADGCTNIEL